MSDTDHNRLPAISISRVQVTVDGDVTFLALGEMVPESKSADGVFTVESHPVFHQRAVMSTALASELAKTILATIAQNEATRAAIADKAA